MSKYDPQNFINALNEKTNGKHLVCPYCGGKQFTTTEDFASILISKELSGLSLGPNIPAGMIVCQNCGHMDFFALGALNLLEKKEAKENGK